MFEWNEFWRIFSLIFLGTAIPVSIIIILEKRSPYKTMTWIAVLILLPIIGVVFYLFFGQQYRKRKLFSRKGIESLGKIRKLSSKQLGEFSHNQLSLTKEAKTQENIIRLLLNNSDSLLTTGNNLKILNNGAKTFQVIFEAIKKARHHIHLEYYIFSDDKIGNQLVSLLISKRKEGVEIRIIIDDVGSWGLKKKFISRLKNNGIEIYSFMEVRFPRFTSKVNYRNHRKIIVIDGKTGFTGGINVADRYVQGIKKIGPWRDTHVKIEGNAATCLQVVFAADWYVVAKENLTGNKYFPPFTEGTGIPIQISASGPDSDWENIGQAIFAAIANAKKRIYLATPYLMLPSHLDYALKTAALSNVDVRILIPEKSDSITPKWSSFSFVEGLLEAGAKIYFYQAGFTHSKFMIVDDVFSTVGTTNMDFRSLETNFEVNAFIYDKHIASQLVESFLNDLKNSREIKLSEWHNRPWHFKFRESLAHIISPML